MFQNFPPRAKDFLKGRAHLGFRRGCAHLGFRRGCAHLGLAPVSNHRDLGEESSGNPGSPEPGFPRKSWKSHALPRFSLQDECPDPRKNMVFEEIGVEMLWRKKGTPRKLSAAPIISKINKTLIILGIPCRLIMKALILTTTF